MNDKNKKGKQTFMKKEKLKITKTSLFMILAIILIAIFCISVSPVTMQNDTYYTIKIEWPYCYVQICYCYWYQYQWYCIFYFSCFYKFFYEIYCPYKQYECYQLCSCCYIWFCTYIAPIVTINDITLFFVSFSVTKNSDIPNMHDSMHVTIKIPMNPVAEYM